MSRAQVGRRGPARLAAGMSLVAITATVVATGAGSALASENSELSTGYGVKARYHYKLDQINICDTVSDGFSVYAQFTLNDNNSVNRTSQFNGKAPNCGVKTIGPLRTNTYVKMRAARQVEGGSDNYGNWVTGVA